jgi:hypothetical protein
MASLVVGGGAWAKTLVVSQDGTGDYKTIQRAIIAAQAGDVVLVSEGEYRESIDFLGRPIAVRSTYDPAHPDPGIIARTVISGAPYEPAVVLFEHAMEGEAVLAGLTIRGGHASGGPGIRISAVSPTIRDNVISGNHTERGGGILIEHGAAPLLTGNTIRDNAAEDGGGIYCLDAFPTIQGNTIAGNSVVSATGTARGGGICCVGFSAPIIEGNRIEANVARKAQSAHDPEGGGIYCGDASSPAITGNTIRGNVCGDLGGSTARARAKWRPGWGGGVYCGGQGWQTVTSALISGNLIYRNRAHEGGGVCVVDYASARLTNNTLVANCADQGGGVWFGYRSGSSEALSYGVMENCIIAFSDGAGVWRGSGSRLTMRCCDVYGNTYDGKPTDYAPVDWNQTGRAGNISADPRFVDTDAGDFRLGVLSPCIDAGMPSSPWGNEPEPNGGRINMGFDGNTSKASQSGTASATPRRRGRPGRAVRAPS